jgi:hypothetical protein
MANTGKATKPWNEFTSYERLPNESDEPWAAFVCYRDMGPRKPGIPGRSLDRVLEELGKQKGYLRNLKVWSVRYDWGRRARKWDDELEVRQRKQALRKIPYWERRRQHSHRENMKLASELRKKLREMLDHPTTVKVVREVGGEEMIVQEPAKWTYNTVATLARTIAELESATIADAIAGAEDANFDIQTASIEELRHFIATHTGHRGIHFDGFTDKGKK